MSQYKKTPYRISTMTIVSNWGIPLERNLLFEQLKSIIIPLWYPGEGILKYEHNNIYYGNSYKDVFTNRKIPKKAFFNQSTIIVRRYINNKWKEINIKLFENGGIQMTGVSSKEVAEDTILWLSHILSELPKNPFMGKTPVIKNVSIPLINTDFSIGCNVDQEKLHSILVDKYNLISILEKTIYQGINTKYFYNKKTSDGICHCLEKCNGSGEGNCDGDCKKITVSIFRTGKIIITGARTIEQIDTVYCFINNIIERHYDDIIVL